MFMLYLNEDIDYKKETKCRKKINDYNNNIQSIKVDVDYYSYRLEKVNDLLTHNTFQTKFKSFLSFLKVNSVNNLMDNIPGLETVENIKDFIDENFLYKYNKLKKETIPKLKNKLKNIYEEYKRK
jgi:hypothetical protein